MAAVTMIQYDTNLLSLLCVAHGSRTAGARRAVYHHSCPVSAVKCYKGVNGKLWSHVLQVSKWYVLLEMCRPFREDLPKDESRGIANSLW